MNPWLLAAQALLPLIAEVVEAIEGKREIEQLGILKLPSPLRSTVALRVLEAKKAYERGC